MSAAMFAARLRVLDEIAVLDLSGQMNAFSEEPLMRAFQEAQAAGKTAIVLNFSQVEYINSTGIALIVSLLGQARKAGQELAVYGLSDHYREIFQITRLVEFLPIFPDETSARAAAPRAP